MRVGGKKEWLQLSVREKSRKSKGFHLRIGLAYSCIAYKPKALNSKLHNQRSHKVYREKEDLL